MAEQEQNAVVRRATTQSSIYAVVVSSDRKPMARTAIAVENTYIRRNWLCAVAITSSGKWAEFHGNLSVSYFRIPW